MYRLLLIANIVYFVITFHVVLKSCFHNILLDLLLIYHIGIYKQWSCCSQYAVARFRMKVRGEVRDIELMSGPGIIITRLNP